MQRDIFTSEHDDFRDMVRAFIAKEVTPYHEQWEADRMVSRDVWLAAGRAGLLGIEIEEKYGGGGVRDYRYYLILDEEMAKAGANGPGFAVHNDINGPYLQRLGTPEQCERWLPGYCSGELITAIAMTEHAIGAIATIAILVVTSEVVDQVPQLAAIGPYLPTHWWLSFDSILRAPVDTSTLLKGLMSFGVYVVLFGSFAWARFTSADVTS